VNLFIADDTGLGKTIEAGLIARELLLRKKAKSIVVAAPPSVLDQWKAELEDRFGCCSRSSIASTSCACGASAASA
jgi:SNF2 family DNA or RNA helicase